MYMGWGDEISVSQYLGVIDTAVARLKEDKGMLQEEALLQVTNNHFHFTNYFRHSGGCLTSGPAMPWSILSTEQSRIFTLVWS